MFFPTELSELTDAVRRRLVFYLSGFDPQGPAHYHRLYAEEGPRQAAVSGYRLVVGPRQRGESWSARWDVEGEFPGGEKVWTRVEFLRWDDIVRAHWPRSRAAVMLSALSSTWAQLRNGVLWRVLRTSWPAFLVLAMPPLLVLGLAMGVLIGAGMAMAAIDQGRVMGALLGFGAFGVIGWRFASWAEQRVQMAWLMRSTRFILLQARGRAPMLEARLDVFGERVAAAVQDESFDEVLVVGHSSGAMLAVSVVARAIERLVDRRDARSRLSLLTVGECIPILSYQPEASAFRAELARLSRPGAPDWVDFTAPPDGCCFALVDPTAVARERGGPSGHTEWQSPKLLSARFAQLFDAAAYRQVRADKYRCHFQYLMAGQVPGVYDYFAITAGPLRLSDRFRDQPSVTTFRQFQTFGGPSA